jgi:metal-responsive CopG/Arc/MetJ family transcriptional regulator
MARRQVLVQLDDALVAELDALAARMGSNRSELIRRGARAVLDADADAAADRQMQAAYRRSPQEPDLVDAARRLAIETMPEW